MGKIVRLISLSFCCFLAASSFASAQGADQFIASHVKPHLAAYAECAKQFLGQAAKKEPANTFERIESSLRPACGFQIDQARDALFRGNFSRSEANAVIRAAYSSIQPELRSSFEQAAYAEKIRRENEKRRPAQPPAGEETGSLPQDHTKEVEFERTKFLKEASSAFDNCLAAEMKSLVPSSSESAETLTKVIEIKCSDLEKRLTGLGVAFYGASRDDFQRIVKEPIDERKRRLVADIVTLRADLAKEAAKQPNNSSDATGSSKPSGSN
ncbi:hypothetical protein [Methylocystis parvus]|uniref:hypothetical protein n=1 Tax=Methylocystis parvus TaxID=134 RepID=UPI003C78D278